ncbi:hypothetical protein [Xenorhabdus szentirmaii]|nr:hypothetical protein [Xenorhabdus szentirmaii]
MSRGCIASLGNAQKKRDETFMLRIRLASVRCPSLKVFNDG